MTCLRVACAALFATLGIVSATGCASEVEEDESAEVEGAIGPGPFIADGDMVESGAPRGGMPRGWKQPDSEGWFNERGKCGATAVANTLLFYGHTVSPEQAYDDGVRFVIGAAPGSIVGYLERTRPELGCRTFFAGDRGPAVLRAAIDSGRPVMFWFNTEGFQSHWVTAVGRRGAGADEEVYVMSWGKYYRIKMEKLARAWANVYGFRSPGVLCSATSPRMAP